MKNIFKIHVLFYLVALICFITGLFKKFTIFMTIILVHELGHILTALFFKWKIDKIIILPFGGITIFKESIDKPLIEELLIAINGPMFQIIMCLFFSNKEVIMYSNIILLFNLLPMFPLDGSKIMNVFFNLFLPYKLSHTLSIILSYFVFVFLLFFMLKFNLVFFIILIFILVEIFKETLKHKYYFNKFLLERYLYNYNFKKRKTISKIDRMYKQTKHIFKIKNKYYTEREIMQKIFDK